MTDWILRLFRLDDPNTIEPCPECKGEMSHVPGRESASTAEARFRCRECRHEEFRGGWGSELKYDSQERWNP